jgi:hypothetical protein
VLSAVESALKVALNNYRCKLLWISNVNIETFTSQWSH